MVEKNGKLYLRNIPNAPEDNRPLSERSDREYGKLTSNDYLYVSKHPLGEPLPTQ